MVSWWRTLSVMAPQIPVKPWVHTVYDLAIAVLMAFVTLQYNEGYDLPIGWAMAAAMIFRRRRPMAVMAAVSALALVQYLLAVYPSPTPLAGDVTGYDAAVLIAMVTVVSHAEPIWKGYIAGGIVLVGVVLVFGVVPSFGTPDSEDSFLEFLTVAGLCTALWLTAYVLRTRRLYTASLEERAATAERERAHLAQLSAAEERAKIARELHDVVAHSLAVMIVQADGAGYAVKTDRERAAKAMRTIADTGRDALEDMHRIVQVLRGTRASDTDTEADPDADRRRIGLDNLAQLVERSRSDRLDVDLSIEGDSGGLSTTDELTIFRLVQECLTNALRHAGPGARVGVTLRFGEGRATLEVLDDGAGKLADTAPTAPTSGGNGLVGMRERVETHGGRFTAGPRLGTGWQVRAEFPVKVAV